jgi:hypothetical protein
MQYPFLFAGNYIGAEGRVNFPDRVADRVDGIIRATREAPQKHCCA